MNVAPHLQPDRPSVSELIASSAGRPIAAKTIQPDPSWPVVLLPLKLLAKPLDRGAGDIIARVIGPIGGDAFKKWYKTIFGTGCGCGQRQDEWNKRWPL